MVTVTVIKIRNCAPQMKKTKLIWLQWQYQNTRSCVMSTQINPKQQGSCNGLPKPIQQYIWLVRIPWRMLEGNARASAHLVCAPMMKSNLEKTDLLLALQGASGGEAFPQFKITNIKKNISRTHLCLPVDLPFYQVFLFFK